MGAKMVTYGLSNGTAENTAVFIISLIIPIVTTLRFIYAIIMIPRRLKKLGVYDG